MDYMTLKEAGQKWNVTPRQVNYLCSGGRIPGAVKMAGVWLIPKAAEKPIDALHCICCVYGNSSIQYDRNGFSDGTGPIGW